MFRIHLILQVMHYYDVLYVLEYLRNPKWSLITCWVWDLKISWKDVSRHKYLNLDWPRVFIMPVFLSDRDTSGNFKLWRKKNQEISVFIFEDETFLFMIQYFLKEFRAKEYAICEIPINEELGTKLKEYTVI